MNMNTNDAWKQLFGAAPFLLLIGIIIVIYLTAFTALFAHILGATTQSSTSASEEVLAELRDFCQSHSLSEQALRQRLSSLDKQDGSYHILLYDICGNEHVTPKILKCFIEYFPKAVRCADSRGLTPLYCVLWNKNCTVDIVRCLTEAFSDDLLEVLRSQDDDEGFTPLAILCLNRKLDQIEAVKILRLFMEKCPECAQCRMGGVLPIEVAVRKRSPEFCCVLADAFPESMFCSLEVAREPLLVSVLQSPDMDDRIAFALLKMLLKNHLEMIRRFRWNACSVLHHLVARTNIPRSVELCRLLIVALPELVFDLAEMRTGAQFMPIHIACCHWNLPIVKCILDMCPDAIYGAFIIGTFRTFPIHIAVHALCDNEVESLQMVKFLLSVNVSVASQRDTNGDTPFILACRFTTASNLFSGLEVITSLFNTYPNAIYGIARDAIREGNNTGVEVVANFLIAQRGYAETARDLEQVRTLDENGYLPIHRALHDGAASGTIDLLAQADLTTLQTTNRNGNTLLHEACCLPNYDVVEMILTRYPTAIVCTSITNSLGKLPIQLLLEHDYNQTERARHLNCIFLLLQANPASWSDANILRVRT